MKRRRLPVITLLILAPVFGELVSSSSPPKEFFTPIGFILLVALYGCGALFIRELARHWGKGWMSIFLLGLAYGIFEEGIFMRSFFDPSWQDLGVFNVYGRWLGVNWVWAIGLMLFHAIVSITLPILLVETAFPQEQTEPWLGRKGLIITGLVFISTVLLTPLFSHYQTIPGIAGSIAVIIMLLWLAYRLPKKYAPPTVKKSPLKPGWIGLASLTVMLGYIILFWGFASIGIPALISFLALCGYPLFILWLIQKFEVPLLNDSQKWAAAFGSMIPWALLDFISEADNPNRPDDTTGMAFVGLALIAGILLLGRKVQKRNDKLKAQPEHEEIKQEQPV